MIEARNIEKSFGDLKVLKGIDFVTDKAEVVAIMGASGAASVLYAKDAKALKDEGKVEEAKAYIKEKEAEYEKLFANPYQAAKYG